MRLKIAALLGVALLAISATGVKAIEIDSSYLIGVSSGGNSSPASEEARLDYFVDVYNGLTPTPPAGTHTPYTGSAVPAPPIPDYDPLTDASTAQTGAGQNLLSGFGINVAGWNYLMVKWGNEWAFYYVGGLTDITVKNDVVLNQNGGPLGVSHYRLFDSYRNDVPDGGLTAMLLGLALSGMGATRRFLKK